MTALTKTSNAKALCRVLLAAGPAQRINNG
jgi:hypothetical protein